MQTFKLGKYDYAVTPFRLGSAVPIIFLVLVRKNCCKE